MPTEQAQTSQLFLPPFTREHVAAMLSEWGRTYAPRPFMVYGIIDDPDVGHDGDVLAWGLGFPDHVHVQSEHSNITGRFTSTDTMRRILFRRHHDIRLLWIDPEPE